MKVVVTYSDLNIYIYHKSFHEEFVIDWTYFNVIASNELFVFSHVSNYNLSINWFSRRSEINFALKQYSRITLF